MDFNTFIAESDSFFCAHGISDLKRQSLKQDLWHQKKFGSQSWSSTLQTQVDVETCCIMQTQRMSFSVGDIFA